MLLLNHTIERINIVLNKNKKLTSDVTKLRNPRMMMMLFCMLKMIQRMHMSTRKLMRMVRLMR
jgi:hypothetical protein